jgi:hypothetical protein
MQLRSLLGASTMPPSQSAVAEQRETARWLDEAHKLLDEIANMLVELRRTMMATNSPNGSLPEP